MTKEYTPEVTLYPFHASPGEDQEYHGRCTKHPEWTPCGTLAEVGPQVDIHLRLHRLETFEEVMK